MPTAADNRLIYEAYRTDQAKSAKLEKLLADFRRVGDEQRGLPEHLMLKFQEALGGGVHSYIAEHVGDLSHRASLLTPWGEPMGYEFVNEKVNKCLRTLLNPYGFNKERNENIHSNATVQYMADHPELKTQYEELINAIRSDQYDTKEWNDAIDAKNDFWHKVYRSPEVRQLAIDRDIKCREIGRQYANAHRTEVHPLTTLQKLGQQAAIGVGDYKFDDTIVALETMKSRIAACKGNRKKLNELYFEGYKG